MTDFNQLKEERQAAYKEKLQKAREFWSKK